VCSTFCGLFAVTLPIFCSFHATQGICENENCENPLLQEPSLLQTGIFVTVNKEACTSVLKNQFKFPSIWYIRLHTFCNDFHIICETQQMCHVYLPVMEAVSFLKLLSVPWTRYTLFSVHTLFRDLNGPFTISLIVLPSLVTRKSTLSTRLFCHTPISSLCMS
jgi:hypothetical protein